MRHRESLFDRNRRDNRAEEVFLIAVSQSREIDCAVLALDGERKTCRRLLCALSFDVFDAHAVFAGLGKAKDVCIGRRRVLPCPIELYAVKAVVFLTHHADRNPLAMQEKLKAASLRIRIEPGSYKIGSLD